MKKKILSIILILMLIGIIFILTGCGQENKEATTEEVTKVGNLDLEVESISSFSEGLALIKKDGKYGYIDTEGNIVIECIYDDAYNFSDGLAAVATKVDDPDSNYGYSKQWGIINTEGEFVVEYQFKKSVTFSNGVAIVEAYPQSNNYVIDKEGNTIFDEYNIKGIISSELFLEDSTTASGYDVIDIDGNIILESVAEATKLSDGLFGVKEGGSYTFGKWGFSDENGNIVIDYIYDYVGNFVDGIAGVVLDGKIGYINTSGEYIIEPTYDYTDNVILRDYSCGIVRIYDESNNITYFFDSNGNKIFEIEKSGGDFWDNLSKVKQNDLYGYINTDGEIEIECKYTSASDFSEGLALVYTDDNTFEFINNKGKTIIAGKIVD